MHFQERALRRDYRRGSICAAVLALDLYIAFQRITWFFREVCNLVRIYFYAVLPNEKASIRQFLEWLESLRLRGKNSRQGTLPSIWQPRRRGWRRVLTIFSGGMVATARSLPDCSRKAMALAGAWLAWLTGTVNPHATSISATLLTWDGISALASSLGQSASA